MIKHSATLAINEKIAQRRARGETVVHLGFGEAGIPVLPEAAEALASAASRTDYGPVAGSEDLRTQIAGYFDRRGRATHPEQVLPAPGSKALLYALIQSLPGDVVLPRPSWVSYAAQAALAGQEDHLGRYTARCGRGAGPRQAAAPTRRGAPTRS